MNDEKNILSSVLYRRLGYAQATQVAPDELGAAFIHLRKGGR
jgi:hypothetical protein